MCVKLVFHTKLPESNGAYNITYISAVYVVNTIYNIPISSPAGLIIDTKTVKVYKGSPPIC